MSNQDNQHVWTEYNHDTDLVKIYYVMDEGPKKVAYQLKQDGNVDKVENESSMCGFENPIKPLITIPRRILTSLIPELANNIDRKFGLVKKDQNRIEGQLEAQKEHLDDLRKIIGLDRGSGAFRVEINNR